MFYYISIMHFSIAYNLKSIKLKKINSSHKNVSGWFYLKKYISLG